MDGIKLGGIAFLLVGCAALVGGAYFLVAHTVFWITAESTAGTVVGWEYMEVTPRRDYRVGVFEGSRAKATVVTFDTADGATIVFATDVGSAAERYSTGEAVTVLYDPEDPTKARIRGFVDLYVGPLLLTGLGAVFAFLGFIATGGFGLFEVDTPPARG